MWGGSATIDDMQLTPNELARRTVDGSVFRHDAVGMSVVVGPVVSRDGHEMTITGRLSVRIVERDADLELFKEQLLASNDVVTIDTVRTRLLSGLETTLSAFAAAHDAETAVGKRTTVAELILERANEIGFACGLECVPPADASVDCPSLEARRAAERIDKDQAARLDRAAKAIEHAKSLGSADGLRPEDQATLLQLLMRGTPARHAIIAAGENVVRLDPTTGDTTADPIRGIGLVRSVAAIGDRACVGGQSGVRIDDRVYALASNSQRGINSIAIDQTSHTLVAAHSELGLLRWNIESAEPMASVTNVVSPRFLTAIDERILFASADQLMRLDGDRAGEVHRASGEIINIHLTRDAVWVVCENGAVERLNRSDLRVRSGFRRSTKLCASTVIEVQGMSAIVLAGESGPMDVLSTSGAPLLELHGRFQALRMLCACGPSVVGISADRQSAVVWSADRPHEPTRVINLVARHGHRATDICCGDA